MYCSTNDLIRFQQNWKYALGFINLYPNKDPIQCGVPVQMKRSLPLEDSVKFSKKCWTKTDFFKRHNVSTDVGLRCIFLCGARMSALQKIVPHALAHAPQFLCDRTCTCTRTFLHSSYFLFQKEQFIKNLAIAVHVLFVNLFRF